jgi:hypothetical protein
MVKAALVLLRESSYRSAFGILATYVRPELIMAGLYAAIWVDPLVFGQKTFEGLTWGLWLEFVLAHAQTGTAVVSMLVPRSTVMARIALTAMSLFYLIFVGAVSFALGSILTVVMFVILSIKRITNVSGQTDFMKEVLYAFFKVMIFLLTAAIGAGIGKLIPADVSGMELSGEGNEIVPAWGVCYFIAQFFYEDKIARKHFRNEEK